MNEPVQLTLELKNISKLTIKVFEFNTETYYKKNLKPFDTSIDLQGMVPSFTKVETALFENVSKTKILSHTFHFEQLAGKVGLFIVEFMANGMMSRAVIKKGSLTLIHRSTVGGHIGFIIDSERQICKGNNTGVWIENKFHAANQQKNGAIFIPYSKDTDRATKLIMIHDGFA